MEENKSYVYRHRKAGTSEVFYIGIGQNSNYKRAYDKSNRSSHWKSIDKKYGTDVEIIAKNLSWEDAKELEMFLISEYGRKDLGKGNLINYTDGGDGTLGREHTEEWKKTRSKAMSGENNPFYGKKLSEEHRKKVSEAAKGRKHTEETKKRMSSSANSRVRYNAKRVIDPKTLEIFDSVIKAASFYGYNKYTLNDQLTGRVVNKSNLVLLSEYIEQNPNFKYER